MFKRLNVDSMLLAAAQELCDRIQRRAEVTKFALEKWAVITASAFFWSASVFRPDPVTLGLALVFACGAFLLASLYEKQEAEFLATGKPALSLWHSAPKRIFAISFYGGASIMLPLPPDEACQLTFGGMVCLVVWIYFSACTPQPSR